MLDVLDGGVQALALQLLEDAVQGFDPGLGVMDGIVVVQILELRIQDLQPDGDHFHGRLIDVEQLGEGSRLALQRGGQDRQSLVGDHEPCLSRLAGHLRHLLVRSTFQEECIRSMWTNCGKYMNNL